MFGKPGRPREDRPRRQREIYAAVAPLLERVGAGRLTMRQAAAAAHMSPGGLYHYFPSKRDLVLHGLDPEALAERCQEFQRSHGDLEARNPERYVLLFVDWLVQEWKLVRPALLAAVELGAGPVLDRIERVIDTGLDEFVRPLTAARPDLEPDELRSLGKVMRRTLIGAMLDRSVRPSDLRHALLSIIGVDSDARPAVADRRGVGSLTEAG